MYVGLLPGNIPKVTVPPLLTVLLAVGNDPNEPGTACVVVGWLLLVQAASMQAPTATRIPSLTPGRVSLIILVSFSLVSRSGDVWLIGII
jgi:hypothetical protein